MGIKITLENGKVKIEKVRSTNISTLKNKTVGSLNNSELLLFVEAIAEELGMVDKGKIK